MPGRTLAERVGAYGDVAVSEGLGAQVVRYLSWMGATRFTEASVASGVAVLGCFLRWCEARGVTQPAEVSWPLVERYQQWLYERRRPDGKPLDVATQRTRLMSVRSLFSWLVREGLVPYNPAADLELPRPGRRLPRGVLTYAEVERVLGVPDVLTRVGLRDRAMMEVFYSTGVRRFELARLALADVEEERGTLWVREGKGRKDRVVPIGDRALEWVQRYQVDARPAFLAGDSAGVLFLSSRGRSLTLHYLTQLVGAYVTRAEVGKRGSCHLFRHTMATLMLENGADVRYVQEMLGHAALSTTQIYTHVSIRMLKEVHAATHPAQVGLLERPGRPAYDEAREQLLEALAAESREDSKDRG